MFLRSHRFWGTEGQKPNYDPDLRDVGCGDLYLANHFSPTPPDLNSALNNKKLQISFLIFASLLIFLGRQLDTGITIYDDVYYAQKAKEVLNSGSLWDITFAGC